MYLCFVDDVELTGLFDAWSMFGKDVYALACYLVDTEKTEPLLASVGSVKAKYGLDMSDPVKFNLKDTRLEKLYKERDRLPVLQQAISQGECLRADLLGTLSGAGAVVLVCATWPFSGTPKKGNLFQWAFENLMQRVGLQLRDRLGGGSPSLQVIVDRPDKEELYASYHEGFYRGVTSGGQQYYSGSLRNLKALDTLSFSDTLHSNFLQLADLIAGASRAFLRWCHDGKEAGRARILFGPIADSLAKDNQGRIHGAGFKISPEPEFRIDDRIAELMGAAP